MANNVMFIVNNKTGEEFKFAKYYPSTGWYFFHLDQFNKGVSREESITNRVDELDQFFEKNDSGETDWEIKYMHCDDKDKEI